MRVVLLHCDIETGAVQDKVIRYKLTKLSALQEVAEEQPRPELSKGEEVGLCGPAIFVVHM